MASLREYRKKIKSVKSTLSITKAMKMVAAARLRRAQNRILTARPFAIRMHELLVDLAGRITTDDLDGNEQNKLHPMLTSYESNKSVLILVTADKGLCGSFNTNLIKKAAEYLTQNRDKDIKIICVGRKGSDFFRRLHLKTYREYTQIFNNLSYTHAEIIGNEVIDLFVREKLSDVTVIYNEFKSMLQQKLTVEKLMPVERPLKAANAPPKIDYLYEPAKENLLDELLPRIIKSQIFRILLESYSSELGARMAAMDSASRNAKELIGQLTLRLNRTRQAIITKEIAELVGGAEALK